MVIMDDYVQTDLPPEQRVHSRPWGILSNTGNASQASLTLQNDLSPRCDRTPDWMGEDEKIETDDEDGGSDMEISGEDEDEEQIIRPKTVVKQEVANEDQTNAEKGHEDDDGQDDVAVRSVAFPNAKQVRATGAQRTSHLWHSGVGSISERVDDVSHNPNSALVAASILASSDPALSRVYTVPSPVSPTYITGFSSFKSSPDVTLKATCTWGTPYPCRFDSSVSPSSSPAPSDAGSVSFAPISAHLSARYVPKLEPMPNPDQQPQQQPQTQLQCHAQPQVKTEPEPELLPMPEAGAEAEAEAEPMVKVRRSWGFAYPCSLSDSPEVDDEKCRVCGINGCQERVLWEWIPVRRHIMECELHLGRRPEKGEMYKCAFFPQCTFVDAYRARVAEHVCSSNHLNVLIKCYACGRNYGGRLSSFKRHREGERGKSGSCKYCEGCGENFAHGSHRVQHETSCAAAQAARRDRLKKKVEDAEDYRAGMRKRRKEILKEKKRNARLQQRAAAASLNYPPPPPGPYATMQYEA